jgi:hypothetical protein
LSLNDSKSSNGSFIALHCTARIVTSIHIRPESATRPADSISFDLHISDPQFWPTQITSKSPLYSINFDLLSSLPHAHSPPPHPHLRVAVVGLKVAKHNSENVLFCQIPVKLSRAAILLPTKKIVKATCTDSHHDHPVFLKVGEHCNQNSWYKCKDRMQLHCIARLCFHSYLRPTQNSSCI